MSTTLQTGDYCQTNEPNNSFPIESLRFPLDSSIRIIFTGYFNGFSVEVKSEDESALLYHMGCFGKGSTSRSKPKAGQNSSSPHIMRRRQFVKRNYWCRKFGSPRNVPEEDMFLKETDELIAKIINDSKVQSGKDVIDLVSSDDELHEVNGGRNSIDEMDTYQAHEDEDLVVIVPNSDSEDENYFAHLKPKCCLNKIKIQEKLMLTLQEAFFLMYGLGCLQIINCDNELMNIQQCWDLFVETDKNFVSKYVVYHYFRSKGYVVKPGIKFGGDYLLYKDGPEVTHADFIVVVRNDPDELDWVSALGHVRMAVTTVKEVLIAEVVKPSLLHVKLPENLSTFSVREILLSRKMPVTLNDDIE